MYSTRLQTKDGTRRFELRGSAPLSSRHQHWLTLPGESRFKPIGIHSGWGLCVLSWLSDISDQKFHFPTGDCLPFYNLSIGRIHAGKCLGSSQTSRIGSGISEFISLSGYPSLTSTLLSLGGSALQSVSIEPILNKICDLFLYFCIYFYIFFNLFFYFTRTRNYISEINRFNFFIIFSLIQYFIHFSSSFFC